MKKYLIYINNSNSRACANVAYYADTPSKNYRVYYCGSDTGLRFDRLGNASRALERLAGIWEQNGFEVKKQHAKKDEIPRRGSNA